MSAKVRRFAVRPAGRPNSEINVTPLVDVVLVLLIIFMVLTPLLEEDIAVRVPATEEVTETTEVPPDQIVVSLNAKGELSLNTGGGAAENVAPEALIEKLRPILDAKAPGRRLVFFVADDAANYGKLVAAMDSARQAGAKILGLATEPAKPVPAPPQP